jgi:hypothetical protein
MFFMIIDSLGDFRQALENGSCDSEFGGEPLSPSIKGEETIFGSSNDGTNSCDT